ncbi:hypothetical protein A0H81_07044 [Grifola frondosa]|uniref:Uncharacterized protein n=1 Tax=Grifola frondosa TaxID=5627 RepID=A0A1C7ME22_GRIFR|nr:hypothetical protein A0H81_07044 [Grifola frondosa]
MLGRRTHERAADSLRLVGVCLQVFWVHDMMRNRVDDDGGILSSSTHPPWHNGRGKSLASLNSLRSTSTNTPACSALNHSDGLCGRRNRVCLRRSAVMCFICDSKLERFEPREQHSSGTRRAPPKSFAGTLSAAAKMRSLKEELQLRIHEVFLPVFDDELSSTGCRVGVDDAVSGALAIMHNVEKTSGAQALRKYIVLWRDSSLETEVVALGMPSQNVVNILRKEDVYLNIISRDNLSYYDLVLFDLVVNPAQQMILFLSGTPHEKRCESDTSPLPSLLSGLHRRGTSPNHPVENLFQYKVEVAKEPARYQDFFELYYTNTARRCCPLVTSIQNFKPPRYKVFQSLPAIIVTHLGCLRVPKWSDFPLESYFNLNVMPQPDPMARTEEYTTGFSSVAGSSSQPYPSPSIQTDYPPACLCRTKGAHSRIVAQRLGGDSGARTPAQDPPRHGLGTGETRGTEAGPSTLHTIEESSHSLAVSQSGAIDPVLQEAEPTPPAVFSQPHPSRPIRRLPRRSPNRARQPPATTSVAVEPSPSATSDGSRVLSLNAHINNTQPTTAVDVVPPVRRSTRLKNPAVVLDIPPADDTAAPLRKTRGSRKVIKRGKEGRARDDDAFAG